MFDLIYRFPEQLNEALNLSLKVIAERKDFFKRIKESDQILVTGMGGSGIAGDIIFSLCYFLLKKPFLVIKDYQLPFFINNPSLSFVISYSGNTEETIFTYQQFKKINFPLIVITSGGILQNLAQKNDDLLFLLPPNYPPRQALAYLIIPILLTLSHLGIIPDLKKTIKKTITFLKAQRDKLNQIAKRNVKLLNQKIPYILASSYFYFPIALRWKNQLNENAKILAFCNYLPEQNHNEINAFPFLADFKNLLFIFLLKNPHTHKRNLLRTKFLLNLAKKEKIPLKLVEPFKRDNFKNIFSLIMLGDFISYHLALKRKVDPLKIELIEDLKIFLNKRSGV
jgi:glucose/mannose-6-phosphate isomerase